MGRKGPRHRRYVSRTTLQWLRLVGFHYDYPHDAYVLWLVGSRWGPVFRDREQRR